MYLMVMVRLTMWPLTNLRAVKYVAKLQDGTIFEQKGQDGELFEFTVDEGRLVSLFFSMVYYHLMGSQLQERSESLTLQVLCRTRNCWSG
jgi:hypothetical protein